MKSTDTTKCVMLKRCFKLHSIIYFVVKECYTYSFVMSVDHFPCGNESQFEKWSQDRKQNPVEVTYPIYHSIIKDVKKEFCCFNLVSSNVV
jgi:hypothetical protein